MNKAREVSSGTQGRDSRQALLESCCEDPPRRLLRDLDFAWLMLQRERETKLGEFASK
jgi:hypothetical protein